MADGYTRTCGLIGNPVEHTLSPALHNFLAERLGVNLVYVPFHVREENLERAVAGAYGLNILGLNVTVPYKSRVLPFLKEQDSMAAKIGAVNTLVRTAGGFKGYNTDMPGLYRAMCRDGVNPEGARAVVLGAGGVARAVAFLLAEKGAAEIILINRTAEKARRVAREVNEAEGRGVARVLEPGDWGGLDAPEGYLALQATSVGMYPHTECAPLEDRGFYSKIHTGYDLIFNPEETEFMRLVKAAGGGAFNGLGMLLYQGIIAFELWTGLEVDEGLAAEAYEEMRKRGKLTRP